MKFRIVNNAWWMFWARGMVLWPWMWLRPVKVYELYPPDQFPEWYAMRERQLYRHELEHCYQVERLGRLRFYTTYIWYQIRYGYKKNPFEVEANEREDTPLTSQEEAWRENGVVQL